jgi:hypothetical protein
MGARARDDRQRRTARGRPGAGLLALAAAGLLAAGCGSASSSPGVASVGSTGGSGTATTSQDSGAATPASSPAGGGGPGPHVRLAVSGNEKFSACMRSHGVSGFPDPNAQGAIDIGPSSGIDPGSASFQHAMSACRKLLPNGGQPTPQQRAEAVKHMLAFSVCMRKHGLPDFPDPVTTGQNIGIHINSGQGGDLNPNTPTFQAAQKACSADLPGLKGGGR